MGGDTKSNVKLPGAYGSLISGLINAFVNNGANGGAGQAPGNPLTSGGDPFQLYSGPGASFGPPGGSLNGLLDQGNPHNVDGLDNPFSKLDQGGSVTPSSAKKGKGGGGGGGGGSFTFTPVNEGNLFTPSFVGMSPTQPGAVSHPASFVGGSGAPLGQFPSPGKSSSPVAAPGAPGGSKGSGGGTGSGGGGGKKLAGVQYGGTAPAIPPGGEKRPDGRIIDAAGHTIYIPGSGGASSGPNATAPNTGPAGPGLPVGPDGKPTGSILNALLGGGQVAPSDRDPHALNISNIDKGSPGWTNDPTNSNQNTAGFPHSTLLDPSGMSQADYIATLHDQGYTNEEIASLVGGYGFHISNPQQGPPGPNGAPGGDNVSFGWGTGPVVSGPGGGSYHFSNQGIGGPGTPGRQSETPNNTLSSGTGYLAR